MIGPALGSGPFGEFIAIEWLQVVAGVPVLLSAILLVLMMLKHLLRLADVEDVARAGYLMMIASGFAAIVYIIGFSCTYTGLMWEGVFPQRLPQNFLGSGLFFLLGLAIDRYPNSLNRIDDWHDRRRHKV